MDWRMGTRQPPGSRQPLQLQEPSGAVTLCQYTPTPTHKQLHKLAHMLSIQAIGSHTLTHAPTPTHTPKYTSPCTHMHACTLSRQPNHTHGLFHFRLAFFFLRIDFCHRRSQDGFLPTRPCAIEASSSVLHGRMVVSRPKRCRRNNGTC